MRRSTSRVLWPSERGPRVGVQRLDSCFAAYRDAVGLVPALEFHSLRRSYITHLIEDGYDPLSVRQQVGHDHASTTAIYTCVSFDFRTRSLRRVLDTTIEAALRPGRTDTAPAPPTRHSPAGPQRRLPAAACPGRRRARPPLRPTRHPHRPPHGRRRPRRRDHRHRPAGRPAVSASETRRRPHAGIHPVLPAPALGVLPSQVGQVCLTTRPESVGRRRPPVVEWSCRGTAPPTRRPSCLTLTLL
ncbi:tyrosine-type recombinase/integrase [Streptomyces tendae]